MLLLCPLLTPDPLAEARHSRGAAVKALDRAEPELWISSLWDVRRREVAAGRSDNGMSRASRSAAHRVAG